ncbi:MAG: hypothetical protein J6W69_07395 [Bacteroidales bacterium]|nr:hypothetical protein [Bacteroidales bacterium]
MLSLYARNNASQKAEWKQKIRDKFREEIREWLQNDFKFFAITPRENIDSEQFIKNNFQSVLGKIYTPFETQDGQQYYSLALDKNYPQENAFVLDLIESGFYCAECKLGQNPQEVLPRVVHRPIALSAQSLLTVHHIGRYLNQHFLIGCYRSDEQLAWILGNNDKGTNLYNVRLKKRGMEERDGALSSADLAKMDVKFVILYKLGEEEKNDYRVFHVHHHATMDAERMRRAWYPNPHGNYFCYVFDEEVELSSRIDIAKIIRQSAGQRGAPIFVTGEALAKN